MRERREQLLFVVVALVLGLLAFDKLQSGYVPARVPAADTLDPSEVSSPARVHLAGLTEGGERRRNSFAPPRELLPLDPLVLPSPPLPALDVRRPAVLPAMEGAAAVAYRMPAEQLGDLSLPEDDEGGFDEDGLGAGAAADGFGFEPGDEASPDDLYDWIRRVGSNSRTYGRILNDDIYGLKSRPGEDVTFQQVTVRNGRPLGVPFVVPRDEVEEFGLARTFENAYHLRSRALGRGAGSVGARTQLALEMLAAAGREERALEFAAAEARRAAGDAPADPDAARLLATVLRESHDLDGEAEVYRAALADGIADAPLLSDYAGLCRRLGLWERAGELLAQALAISNTAAEVFAERGRLRALAGDHQGALADFTAAVQGRFHPPFVSRQEREASLGQGRAQLALGRVADAVRVADRLLIDDPDDPDALLLLGAARAAAGDHDAAADAFGRALARRPSSSRLLTDAGLVAWLRGDGPGARRLLERAVEAEPYAAFDATLALGFVYEDAGRRAAARDLYDEALRLSPDHPEALYHLGRLQRAAGDPESAHATLRKSLRLGGPDLLLLTELGTAALSSDGPVAASGYLREALRLAPDDAQVLWMMGLTHLREGDLLSAVERLEQAASRGAGGAQAALGVARYRLGQEQQALDHFDEVARVYAGRDDHPIARYAAEQAAAVRDNLGKRQWLDTFGRSALQRGWIERQWSGSPSVRLVPAGVSIAGRMETPRDDERPGIARTVEGRSFVSVQVGLKTSGPGDSRFGVTLTHKQVQGVKGQRPKGRLEIWVDTQGVVRLSVLDNFETELLSGVDSGVRIPPGQRVVLGIERLDPVVGSFRFRVDGRPVGEPVTVKSMRDLSRNTIHLDVFGEAAPGRTCDVNVDLVRIVRLP